MSAGDHSISPETNVHLIDCSSAWPLLTKEEQLYAYHFARASWEGAKICAFQRSYESPGLLFLLRAVFAHGCESLKSKALGKGVTEEEWTRLLVYAAAALQNIGNYTSFGDRKFVPAISSDKFWAVITSSEAYEQHKDQLTDTWESIKDIIYKTEAPFGNIGFRENGGLTAYYSSNVSKKEAEEVKKFQEEKKIAPWNTRLVKVGEKNYCLTIASAEKGNLPYVTAYEWEGLKISVENGEFAPFMRRVVHHLTECLKYVSDANRIKMLEAYIEHFKYGE